MQDKSNIDIKIKEKLGKVTAPMPDGLFDSIMDAMPAAVPQKKGIVWIPYLLLGLGIIILLIFLRNCEISPKLMAVNETNSLSQKLENRAELQGLSIHSRKTLENLKKEALQNETEINTDNKTAQSFHFKLSEENVDYLNNLTLTEPNDFGFLSIYQENNLLLSSDRPAQNITSFATVDGLPHKKITIQTKTYKSIKESVKKHSNLSLRLFAGPSVNYRILKVDAYKDLEKHRNKHEKSYTSFTFGVQLNYAVSQRVELFSGLEYLEVGEKYEFKHNEIEHRTNNTYSYLNIPIGIGYRLNKRDKFYSMVRAQFNTSINNASQASWIDPNSLTAVAHSDKGEYNPYRKVTFSGKVGLEFGVSYNKIALFVSPTANYTLSNIYKAEEAINQHPFSVGANFGVRIKL